MINTKNLINNIKKYKMSINKLPTINTYTQNVSNSIVGILHGI